MTHTSRNRPPLVSSILRLAAPVAVVLVIGVLAAVLGGCVSQAQWYAFLERSAPPGEGDAGGGAPGDGSSGSDGIGDERSGTDVTDGTDPAGAPGEGDTSGEEASSEESATAAEALISGLSADQQEEDLRLFRVTEQYWIETPWFGVSSLIVMVKHSPPRTRILVPEGSLLSGTMRRVGAAVTELPPDYRRERFRVSVSFHLGDVPPFVDPGRYNNPEDYY